MPKFKYKDPEMPQYGKVVRMSADRDWETSDKRVEFQSRRAAEHKAAALRGGTMDIDICSKVILECLVERQIDVVNALMGDMAREVDTLADLVAKMRRYDYSTQANIDSLKYLK